MKLGAFVQQGQKGTMIHYGPLGKYIQMTRAIGLIYLVMKPEFTEKLLTELWEGVDYVPPGAVGYYFILEVDGLSNSLTICVPVYYAATGTVEMDREEYNRLQRDGQLHNLTISWDDILAFRMLNVREQTAKPGDRVTESGDDELTSEPLHEDADESPETRDDK